MILLLKWLNIRIALFDNWRKTSKYNVCIGVIAIVLLQKNGVEFMPRQRRKESPTKIYHVMQRGVGKQIIFEEDWDYKFYLKKLSEFISLLDIRIIAYCLMDNHVHLLLRSETNADISKLIQRLGSSYASYYNEKYFHAGHVFQGRYCCEIVGDEKYFLACARYIHNNPTKAGISARESYRWSSYREYIMDEGITDREILMSILGSSKQFVEFSHAKDDTEVMDCDNRPATTKEALELIRDRYGFNCEDGTAVNRLCKEERDFIIRDLKEMKFTAKQIELLTGVTRAIIYKA